ncbi:transposable element Tc1 transposase [Trichonephila clavipes]|nr:transposable element Tc1 transposase [Trichonephila clavipes]
MSCHSCTRFVVDHAIEDAPVCDAASRVAAVMVSELRVHDAADVVELFVQTLVDQQTTPILDSGLVTWLHDPLRQSGHSLDLVRREQQYCDTNDKPQYRYAAIRTLPKRETCCFAFLFLTWDITTSYPEALVQWKSSSVMRVWKQWTNEHRTTQKPGSERRKVTSARDDRHLIRMAVNDHAASSRLLAARWSTSTGSPSRQSIDGCVCNGLMSTEPGKMIGTKLSSDESRFNLWDHDDRICVRCYAGERCLPESVVERHSGLTPEVMV